MNATKAMSMAFALVVAALAFATPAAAAEQEAASVTWSVVPASDDGPDGRAWVEREVEAGDTITEYLAVRNLSGGDAVFTLSAADGYFTDTGRFNMLASDQTSTGAGTWVRVQERVEVPANGTAVVPFTVTVPDKATPGDHAAGVAASVQSEGTVEGNAVSVESRVGFRVMTRVAGEIEPSLRISSFDAGYDQQWNPLRPGALDVRAVIANTGNVAVDVTGTAATGAGATGLGHDAGADRVELLPGEERVVTGRLDEVWPVVRPEVDVEFVAVAQGADALSYAVGSQRGVWALPLPQVVVLFGTASLMAAVLLFIRHRNRRIERLLADAREAGRAEGAR